MCLGRNLVINAFDVFLRFLYFLLIVFGLSMYYAIVFADKPKKVKRIQAQLIIFYIVLLAIVEIFWFMSWTTMSLVIMFKYPELDILNFTRRIFYAILDCIILLSFAMFIYWLRNKMLVIVSKANAALRSTIIKLMIASALIGTSFSLYSISALGAFMYRQFVPLTGPHWTSSVMSLFFDSWHQLLLATIIIVVSIPNIAQQQNANRKSMALELLDSAQ